ncbi:MAG: hypothetical protein ACUVUD_02395 [bacterium]
MVLNFLLLPVLFFTGFDFGGRIGAAFPTDGIGRTTRSSTLLGAEVGYTFLRHRLELNYSFLDFPSKERIPYGITVHELALIYSFALLHKPNWGIALGAGPGLGYLRRVYHSARETGTAPNGHINAYIYQQERHSRVSAGIDQFIFFNAPSNRTPVLTYLPAIYVEIAYAF